MNGYQDLNDITNNWDAKAQYKLGLHCEENRDYTNAINWYTQAAQQDYVKAQQQLAFLFEYLAPWQKQNKTTYESAAISWYTKAAKQGYWRAQYKLACLYEVGYGGLKKDLQQALIWCQKAVSQKRFAEAEEKLIILNKKIAGEEKNNNSFPNSLTVPLLSAQSSVSPGSPLTFNFPQLINPGDNMHTTDTKHVRAQTAMSTSAAATNINGRPHANSMQTPTFDYKQSAGAVSSGSPTGSPQSSSPPQLSPARDSLQPPRNNTKRESIGSPTCTTIFLNMQKCEELQRKINNFNNLADKKDALHDKNTPEKLRKLDQELLDTQKQTIQLIKEKLKLSKANGWADDKISGIQAFLPAPLLIHAVKHPVFLKAILDRNTPHKDEEKTAKLDVNVQDSSGNTALNMAIIFERNDAIDLLLKHPSIKLDIPNNTGQKNSDGKILGQTPLYLAVSKGDLELVKKLLNDPRQINKDIVQRVNLKRDWLKKAVNVDGKNPLALSAIDKVKELKKKAEENWDKTKFNPESSDYENRYQQYLIWAEIQDYLEPSVSTEITHVKETKFISACEKAIHHLNIHQQLLLEQKSLEEKMSSCERETKSSALASINFGKKIETVKEKITFRIQNIVLLLKNKELIPDPKKLDSVQALKNLVIAAAKDNKDFSDALSRDDLNKYFQQPKNDNIEMTQQRHLVHRWQYYARSRKLENEKQKYVATYNEATQKHNQEQKLNSDSFKAVEEKLRVINENAYKNHIYDEPTQKQVIDCYQNLRSLKGAQVENERRYNNSLEKKNYDNAMQVQQESQKKWVTVLAKEKVDLHTLFATQKGKFKDKEGEIIILEEKIRDLNQQEEQLRKTGQHKEAHKLEAKKFELEDQRDEKIAKLPADIKQLNSYKTWQTPVVGLLSRLVSQLKPDASASAQINGDQKDHKHSQAVSNAGSAAAQSAAGNSASFFGSAGTAMGKNTGTASSDQKHQAASPNASASGLSFIPPNSSIAGITNNTPVSAAVMNGDHKDHKHSQPLLSTSNTGSAAAQSATGNSSPPRLNK